MVVADRIRYKASYTGVHNNKKWYQMVMKDILKKRYRN